jgi:hypothetical protein
MACEHKVIAWLHNERVRGCESCDDATEYEQGELTPCSLIVCVDCGAPTEAVTNEQHDRLLRGA